MAQSISTNVAALSAQRYLNRSQSDITNAMARLSSGLRINSAKDDAAGLASAERLTTQVRGLNVASRNTNDAISLLQAAEGAMGNVTSLVQRIRELAVQSANAGYTASDRKAMNNEAQELISEIQRLSRDTEFNGVKLLNGTFTTQNFQVGANQGQQLAIDSLTDSRPTSLGVATLDLTGTAMGKLVTPAAALPASGVADQSGLTLTTLGGSSQPISWSAGATAADIAKAINDNSGASGVKALAANSATLTSLSDPGTVTMTLNGQPVSATLNNTGDLSELINAINGAGAGVTATFANPPAKDGILLTSSDGADISIVNFDHTTLGATIGVTGPKDSGATNLTDAGSDSTRITGTVELSTSKGAITWSSANADVFSSAGGTTDFKSMSTLDLSSDSGARAALNVIDGALDSINVGRAELGAKQNRLEALLSNIDSMSEVFTTARGRLMDADFAKETAALSRAQILQQAGTAMLAQANALPQQVLQLLKG